MEYVRLTARCSRTPGYPRAVTFWSVSSSNSSDMDRKRLVTDEEDHHHREQTSHTPSSSSSSSSSSSPLSSPCSPSLPCSALRKRRDPTGDRLSPDGERTSACALQIVSMVTGQHLDLKRKQEDEPDGPSDTEIRRFSEKCVELQCFVPPLSSILQGLQSGRYSQRLSSFQESVAMDRIHRILGVLQNPDKGARFLGILLKIEEMLQKWFPDIQATRPDEDAVTKRVKHHADAAASAPLRSLHAAPCCSDVTQDAAVSSSTDSPSPPHLQPTQPVKVRSPCLERLLQVKGCATSPRAAGTEPS